MSRNPLLDFECLEATPARVFRNQRPYPWWAGPALRPEAWQALHEHLPDVEQLEAMFGKERRFGQASHDRYVLEYRQDLPVHPIWHQLVEELEGPAYQRYLARRLGRRPVRLLYHWHYTPRGCSVSPHCDARRKRGSHILYFNDPARWQREWGGETCVLDDEGRFSHRSKPGLRRFRAYGIGILRGEPEPPVCAPCELMAWSSSTHVSRGRAAAGIHRRLRGLLAMAAVAPGGSGPLGTTDGVPGGSGPLAIVLSGLGLGGVQRTMLTLAEGIASRGIPVDLVVPDGRGPFRAQVPPNVRLVELDAGMARLPWVRARKRRRSLASIPALARYLRCILAHARPFPHPTT